MSGRIGDSTARVMAALLGSVLLFLAVVHQTAGWTETLSVLGAAEAPPLYLVQIDATWASATIGFVILGLLLLTSAWRLPWVRPVALVCALWLGGFVVAFVLASQRWGLEELPPHAVAGAGLALACLALGALYRR